ncbi:MAG: HAD hydrolase family protein [Nanoarchaeota archaeon]
MVNPDFCKIKLLVCDFDGVMTDNKVIFREDGMESVVCNRGDGLGIEMLEKKGIPTLIISKERNKVVMARAKKIRAEVLQGVDDKISLFKEEIKRRGLDKKEVCFIGNDITDIDCMKEAGIGVAVADSYHAALRAADHVTNRKGGEGAVREVCDLILGN